MKKALKIIALTAGIISLISTAILCLMHRGKITELFKKLKIRISDKRAKLQDPDDFVF